MSYCDRDYAKSEWLQRKYEHDLQDYFKLRIQHRFRNDRAAVVDMGCFAKRASMFVNQN